MRLRFLAPGEAGASFKKLLFPLAAGIPMALVLLVMVKELDVRALVLFLVCAGFLCFSLILRRFERALFAVVFLLIPINVDINFEIGPTLYAMRLPQGTALLNLSCLDLAVLALYPMWIVRMLTNRTTERIIWPAGSTPFLLFTGWGALTMLNSSNRLLSFIEVICFLKIFLCFFYIANNLKTKEDLWFAAKCILAGLFFESMIGFIQSALHRNIGLYILGERKEEKMMEIVGSASPVFRAGGTLGHPTFLGGYLATFIPLALAAALEPLKRWGKLAAWGVFFLAFLVLILSYCRSAWIVTFIACPILLVRWYRDYLKTHKFSPAPFVVGLIVLACVSAPFYGKIHARLLEDDRGSTESRIPQWKMGFKMVKTHPFLGVGLNNYNVVSDRYEPNVIDPNVRGRVFFYDMKLHNVYLGVAAQVGIVGLLFYLLFLGRLIQNGWNKFKRADDSLSRSLILGVLFGMTAMLLHEAVHTGNISSNLSLWIPAAFLSSAAFYRHPGRA